MRGITQDYQLAGFRYPPVERLACKHWPLEGAIDHFQYLCDSRISSAYSNLWQRRLMCLVVCKPGIPSFKDSSHFFDFISRLPRAGVGMVDVVENHIE